MGLQHLGVTVKKNFEAARWSNTFITEARESKVSCLGSHSWWDQEDGIKSIAFHSTANSLKLDLVLDAWKF